MFLVVEISKMSKLVVEISKMLKLVVEISKMSKLAVEISKMSKFKINNFFTVKQVNDRSARLNIIFEKKCWRIISGSHSHYLTRP